jgi:DNA-binding MarR family transcriptional regulator
VVHPHDDADRLARAIAAQCIGVRVRLLNRRVTRIYEGRLRPHGVTLAQLNILTAVTLLGPVRPAEIGRTLSIEKSTLSRNLRLMESRGWVGFAADGTAHITAAGGRLLHDVAPAWQRAQKETEALLGRHAVSSIADVVDALWAEE